MAPFFFFNDTATTEIYTLSLHDALPIWPYHWPDRVAAPRCTRARPPGIDAPRSEEHTSELQSHLNLVCRLLLEKKKRSHPVSYEHELGLHHRPSQRYRHGATLRP